MVNVSGSKDAYWQELAQRWEDDGDLITIEHDIEIHDQVLREFAACPEPWCAYGYLVGCPAEVFTMGLGCTKLSARARQEVPLLLFQPEHRSWIYLDGFISAALRNAQLEPHIHEPRVAHHREYRLPGTAPRWLLPLHHGVSDSPAVAAPSPGRPVLAASTDAAVYVAGTLGAGCSHAELVHSVSPSSDGALTAALPPGPVLIQAAGWFTGHARLQVSLGDGGTGVFTGDSNIPFIAEAVTRHSGRLRWGDQCYALEPPSGTAAPQAWWEGTQPLMTISAFNIWELHG
jgi:hypothetical protein